MIVMDLDAIELACITTLRTAAAKVIAAPEPSLMKVVALRNISTSLQSFAYVLKKSPSKAAEEFRAATMVVGQLLMQVEQVLVVPVKFERPLQNNKQGGRIFGGMARHYT